MAAVSSKSKKAQPKPPKSRPPATSSLSQPAVEDVWASTVFSSFSPTADLFAIVSLAIDKHRLRIFNTKSNHAVAEYVVEKSRVASLAWVNFDWSDKTIPEEIPSKKRKKSSNTSSSAQSSKQSFQAVALGLADGSVILFSPSHSRVIRTLTHLSSNSAVLSVASSSRSGRKLWTTSEDGAVRQWDIQTSEVVSSWRNDGKSALSVVSLRPGFDDEDEVHVLVGGLNIHLLSFSGSTAKEICSFTGHASLIRYLVWDASSTVPRRFFSSARDDRFIYVWDIPEPSAEKTKPAASCPLDAEVLQIHSANCSGRSILAALSSNGRIIICPVPSELTPSVAKSSKHQTPTLLPRSNIVISQKKAAVESRATSVLLLDDAVRIAILTGGTKLIFEVVKYLDGTGDFVSELKVEPASSVMDLTKETIKEGAGSQRYSEPAHLAVGSGDQTAHGVNGDQPEKDVDGALDVDLAEMSLGERLAAREGTDAVLRGSESEPEASAAHPSTKSKKSRQGLVVPAHSLSRTLIQALHSSDNNLLEACLAHSDEGLVRNTVQRLPPQLSVPLLSACVERLGRGARGNNMKGRGGGASAQKGMGLIVWVRAVLTIHGGYLLTLPDLVARLSYLHSTLTTRLTLQERLLSLSGRLDLVLSQIELRSSTAPVPLATKKRRKNKKRSSAKEPTKYVEGESSDDEEQADVEIEEEDETGSIEDIELRGDSEDESDESDDDEDDGSEEEDEEEEDNMMNGFIDDEAEEDYEEDESDESAE